MALNQLARKAATRVREKLEASIPGHLRDLRVFGSMARGTVHDESDLDLLILLDEDDTAVRDAVFRAVGEVEGELGYPFPISPCIMTSAHYQELLDRELLFARDIEAEGIRV